MQTKFENLLNETIGLSAASIGSNAIQAAIRVRMKNIGVQQLEEYWDCVRASEEELQELIETVVVPETWFFRDEEAFRALARIVFNEWLPNHGACALRILSWPCCSGEEPYSTVISLLDVGVPRERLHVDAVDVSVRALERAKAGVYGPNSFRGGSLAFRDRYFTPATHGYRLTDCFRDVIDFHYGNLVATDFHPGLAHYDIIFCRNVMIYFDSETQARVLQKIRSLLAPAGLLFVGAAEAFLAASNGYKSLNEAMSFAFVQENANRLAPPKHPVLGPTTPLKHPKRAPNLHSQGPVLDVVTPATMASPDEVIEKATRLAEAGRLADAAELCAAYLKENGSSVESLLLLGVIDDAMGNSQSASECYRKVLYLEPNHSQALLHLSLLAEKQGDTVSAKRLRERARRAAMVTSA
jgi:chemotaxis protein methyltransferase WspC